MKSESILPVSFYLQEDVVFLAVELLGKEIHTRFNGIHRYGVITETEAYAGITDRASHAFGGRHTERTRIMYQQGGVAYVYLCYGIHSLFNVVTNVEGIPHAVLIRAIQADGIPYASTNGPGKVSKVLGIHYSHSGLSLQGPEILIKEGGIVPDPMQIKASKRIGIDYAGPDKDLLYRFQLDIPG